MSKCKICGMSEGHAVGCTEHVDNITARVVVDRAGNAVKRVAMTEFEVAFAKNQSEIAIHNWRSAAFHFSREMRRGDEGIAETLARAAAIFEFISTGTVPAAAEVKPLHAVN